MTANVWTLFGQQSPGTVASDSHADVTYGMQFSLSQTANVTGIWWYSPSGATSLPAQCAVFQVSTQAVVLVNTNPTWSGAAGSGWVKCSFDGTTPLFAGVNYIVAVWFASTTTIFGATAGFWTTGGTGANGLTNGIITAPNDASAVNGQCPVNVGGASITFPGAASPNVNYWVDIEVTTGLSAASPPVPGFALQSPRTWNSGDEVTTPRLRADMYNMSALMGQGRPALWAEQTQETVFNTVQLINRNDALLNSWNTIFTQGQGLAAGPGTATFYPVPLPGWYLVQGWVGQNPVSGGAAATQYAWGIIFTQGTTTAFPTRIDLGTIQGPSAGTMNASTFIGNSCGELLPFNPATGDIVGPFAYTTASGGSNAQANWMVEWVGLPSSGTLSGAAYTGPVGTVVASPKPATLWPPGPGVSLGGPVSAGGSILTLPPTPGLRAGQVIGLDWQNSQQAQPYAETVTVASVAGGTVTTSTALLYGHSAGAPVAVPVSAALLNEQIRDQSNFLFYPPLLRACQGTASAQSIASSTWTTVSLALTGGGIVNSVDNFGGWAATTANSYTIPVSGLYMIIGQVFLAGASVAADWGAAFIDNNGVRYQGDFYRTASSTVIVQGPAARRVLRLTAGQTIALQVFQTSGSSVLTQPSIVLSGGSYNTQLPRLILVFRAF